MHQFIFWLPLKYNDGTNCKDCQICKSGWNITCLAFHINIYTLPDEARFLKNSVRFWFVIENDA